MWKRGLFFLFVVVLMQGCMWKSTHEKIVGDLNLKMRKLRQEKEDLQAQFDDQSRKLKATKEELQRLAQLRIKLENKMSQLTQEKVRCLSDLKALAAKGGTLSKRLSQALDQIQKLQRLADKRKATFDRLKASFQAMVDAGKLRVKMVRGLLVLQLAEKILFSSGQYAVKREGKAAIAEVAKILAPMKRRWQVVGHTDSKGRPSVNWRLSVLRALAVLNVMLKNGMPPEYISAAGFGQYQPVAPNDTPEHRALNRRTEIILLPNLQELQLAEAPSPFWACRLALAQKL